MSAAAPRHKAGFHAGGDTCSFSSERSHGAICTMSFDDIEITSIEASIKILILPLP